MQVGQLARCPSSALFMEYSIPLTLLAAVRAVVDEVSDAF